MKALLAVLCLFSLLPSGNAVAEPKHAPAVLVIEHEAVVLRGASNAICFRLYTNAAPDAKHLANTYELDAFGATLLQAPARADFRMLLTPTNQQASALHSFVVDDTAPAFGLSNSLRVVEEASGGEWRYVRVDATAAWAGRLQECKRGILLVEPDLIVIHDHLVAKEPSRFRFNLHPPASTIIDSVWHDLRLSLPQAAVTIHAPAPKGQLRPWERVSSVVDQWLPGTVTMKLEPPAQMQKLDLITVLAVQRAGEKKDFAFKLLESTTATGVRIYRNGYPTLVAFRTVPKTADASLTGFGFSGPAGVSVFQPRKK